MTLARFALGLALVIVASSTAVGEPAEASLSLSPLPRGSIHVAGDAGFSSLQSGVRGGSGTSSDPYVISGYVIEQTRAFGIRIENTSAHVVLEDIVVLGAEGRVTAPIDCASSGICEGSRGIDILHASNVTIRSSRIGIQGFAIMVRNSGDIVIEDAVLGIDPRATTSTIVYGVYVQNSHNVTMVGLSTRNVDVPTTIRGSRDVRVEGSAFLAPGQNAIVEGGERVSFDGVSFDRVALAAQGAVRGLSVTHSSFNGSLHGFHISTLVTDRVDGAFFCGNSFTNMQSTIRGALAFTRGSDARIVGNVFEGNGFPLELQRTAGAVVERNSFSGSTARSALIGRYDAEAHNNSFEESVFVFLGAGTQGQDNWWGAADGPSRDGPGTGTPVDIDASNTTFTPFLTAPPDLSVDCDAEGGGFPGHGPVTASARAEARVHVKVNEKVLGVKVKVNEKEHVVVETGDVPLLA